MKLFYQVKNYLYYNVYIGSIIGTICLIITCQLIFWNKEKVCDLNNSISGETDNLINNVIEDFEIIGNDID